MKMYQLPEMYIAVDERGRVAVADVGDMSTRATWTDAETFMRLAYMMMWAQGDLAQRTLADLQYKRPIWERPDPGYTLWDCDDMLVAVDQHGACAAVRKDMPLHEAWYDPQSFMVRNANNGIWWTSQVAGGDVEVERYKRIVEERGRFLWTIPQA